MLAKERRIGPVQDAEHHRQAQAEQRAPGCRGPHREPDERESHDDGRGQHRPADHGEQRLPRPHQAVGDSDRERRDERTDEHAGGDGEIARSQLVNPHRPAARPPRPLHRSRPRSARGSSGRCASCPVARGRQRARRPGTPTRPSTAAAGAPRPPGAARRCSPSASRGAPRHAAGRTHTPRMRRPARPRHTRAGAGSGPPDPRTAPGSTWWRRTRRARRQPAGTPAGWSAHGHLRPGAVLRAQTSLTRRRHGGCHVRSGRGCWANPARCSVRYRIASLRPTRSVNMRAPYW